MIEKHRRLIETLSKLSKEGKLAWVEGIEPFTYQVSFAANSVRIREDDTQGTTGADYWVELINNQGQVVEAFSDNEIDKGLSQITYFPMMRDIYDMARRRALGADKVLDEIMAELERQSKSTSI